MNLIYFEGNVAHIIGFYSIYHLARQDRILAKIYDRTLILHKTQLQKSYDDCQCFFNVSSKEFLDFIKRYCQEKGIDGLQCVEVEGVFYEMYSGDNTMIRRAIKYCKEITELVLDGGYIVFHFDEESLKGENDDCEEDDDD